MATSGSDDDLAAATIGELKPYAVPVVVEDYNPEWPAWYAAEAASVRDTLGSLVLRIEHTGSTSVPGLAAKPVIDILLVVPDTTDEAAYVPPLERAGYTLRIREPDWYQHRCLIRRVEDGAPYDVNLHIFSPELGAAEIERMLAFRDWLRTHDDDRAYYEAAKRELTQRRWKYVQHYADAKSDVVEEILTRALEG
ncbi:GrpB family protein [Nocardia transvalensis]|uniref:GrpB family protein n=1 Tax=Nocardia transvalensis TaxID=37333 RepID=UPI00189481FC|nr:GrpB family protein [Nocardia transvalensis]MBF6332141.1 GrpB family protein [Nocardia transvalensis]